MGPGIQVFTSPTKLSGHIQVSPRLTVTGGTLADDANRTVSVTATFASVITAARQAVMFSITGAGSSAQEQTAIRVDFNAGFTGAAVSRGLHVANANANATPIGIHVEANAAGTQNVALYGDARNGTQNFGLFGGLNQSPSGFAGSAAVAGSNGSGTSDILRAYDAGSLSWRVRDGGAQNLSSLANGSVNTGDLWRDSTQLSLFFSVAGMTHRAAFGLCTTSAAATIASSTTETTLFGTLVGSKTFAAASFFVVGKKTPVEAWGVFGTTATPTGRFRLKLGATTIIDSTAITLPNTVTNMWWHFKGTITCRSVGASGTVIASGVVYYGAAGTLLHMPMVATAAVTVDTTASQILDLTFQWGASDALNTITCHDGFVGVVN
jgi:hypothetical protein